MLHRFLAENQLCWTRAFRRLDLPPPPSLLRGQKNWSMAAYSQFIFGGGKCSVGLSNLMFWCRLNTSLVAMSAVDAELPELPQLALRACSVSKPKFSPFQNVNGMLEKMYQCSATVRVEISLKILSCSLLTLNAGPS